MGSMFLATLGHVFEIYQYIVVLKIQHPATPRSIAIFLFCVGILIESLSLTRCCCAEGCINYHILDLSKNSKLVIITN